MTQVDEKGHEGNTAVVTAYLGWRNMVEETAGQEKFLLTIIHFEDYYKMKMSNVRSRISSKLIFASCVGYFDRAYYGFSVTSSRMLVLIEGNKICQMWNSVSVQIRSM